MSCKDLAFSLAQQLKQIQSLIILITDTRISDFPDARARRLEFLEELAKWGGYDYHEKVVVCTRVAPDGTVSKATQHAYVHAKVTIVDDKFAIIGSANANARGYSHDSEVVAGIFDESCDDTLAVHFAHKLRMRLWAEHLQMSEAEVFDPIGSAVHWRAGRGFVRPFDPNGLVGDDVSEAVWGHKWRWVPDALVDPEAF